MLSPFEPLTSIVKANVDAALQFTSRAAEVTERLIHLQVDATNTIVSSSNENFQALLGKPGSLPALTTLQSNYQATFEKASEIGRHYVETLTRSQSELAQLFGEQVSALSKNAVKNFEFLTKNAIEESEKALKVVEQSTQEKRAA